MASSKALRLFIAVPVCAAAREQAQACIARLRCADADARWVDAGAMHLTLRFLGATPPGRLSALQSALEEAVRGRPAFSVVFDRLGWFGDRSRPEVMWAGVGAGGEPLAELARALESALAQRGFPPEERPFKAHLTLGRVKLRRGAAAVAGQIAEEPAFRWASPVDRLILFSSRLSGAGAVHTELRSVALAD